MKQDDTVLIVDDEQVERDVLKMLLIEEEYDLAFASDGDPRTDALSEWAPYDESTRATAIFDDPVSVASDPYGEERAAWSAPGMSVGTL